LLVLASGAFAAGCGGSDNNDTSSSSAAPASTQASEPESEGTKTACKAPAAKKDTGLPGSFPLPGELTVTSVSQLGPTTVVDGYWTAELDEAYREFKDQVTAANYKIIFTENEHKDAEISYNGSGRTGPRGSTSPIARRSPAPARA
jgi:hypothetical protein